jgi:PAS domain-containing protein
MHLLAARAVASVQALFLEEMPARSARPAPPRSDAPALAPLGEEVFRLLFERSSDAILLLDSHTLRFIDCNDAAVNLLGARTKRHVLDLPPWEISPQRQPDGQLSAEKAHTLIKEVIRRGTVRFEWVHLRTDGREIPSKWCSPQCSSGPAARRHRVARHHGAEACRARDARAREQVRLLFERSADPMLLLDLHTWRFIDGNAAALALMHCTSKEELIGKAPWELSTEFQPDGERSEEKARSLQAAVLEQGSARFEWTHRRTMARSFRSRLP